MSLSGVVIDFKAMTKLIPYEKNTPFKNMNFSLKLNSFNYITG